MRDALQMTESLAAPDLPDPPSNEYIRASIQRVNSLLSAVRPLKLSTPRVALLPNQRPSMLEGLDGPRFRNHIGCCGLSAAASEAAA